MSPTDRAIRLACQVVILVWIVALLGWRELAPREIHVPVKTTALETVALPPPEAEPEPEAEALEAEPEPEIASEPPPEPEAIAQIPPEPPRSEAAPEPEPERVEPVDLGSAEHEVIEPGAARPEAPEAFANAPRPEAPEAFANAPPPEAPEAFANAPPPEAPEAFANAPPPAPVRDAPRPAPAALPIARPVPAPPAFVEAPPVAEPPPALAAPAVAEAPPTHPLPQPPAEAPLQSVAEVDVVRGGSLLTGDGGFPMLESRYEGFGSFHDYARAMQALGAKFVVVQRRAIVGTIDPWTLEAGTLRDPGALSPRARDYAGEPALLSASRTVRRRHGHRAEVMMLVPRRIDAALFGGIARALEARGREPAAYRQIQARYERGPGGALRLRVEKAIRKDGREEPLPLLFDLRSLVRA